MSKKYPRKHPEFDLTVKQFYKSLETIEQLAEIDGEQAAFDEARHGPHVDYVMSIQSHVWTDEHGGRHSRKGQQFIDYEGQAEDEFS